MYRFYILILTKIIHYKKLTTSLVYHNSEPPILLGKNESANPVEFLLHGFAGCLTTTMALHAAARGISVDKISSTLEGD
ncbi:hypothetical protein BH23BAC1_BH23BAC1_47080 [soil metagenome]